MKKWSSKYDKCIQCGTTEHVHVAKGLCRNCYTLDTEKRHKAHQRHKRGVADEFLTKEKLFELYIKREMSLTDIGKLAGTTRVNVYYKLQKFNIPARTKKEARILALDKGKIKKSFTNEKGEIQEETLKKIRFNEDFFTVWSNEMAYVLGLIYTDGNIDPGKLNDPNRKTTLLVGRLTFAQKEIELVEKMLKLMDCDVKISFAKKRVLKNTIAGERYYFHINSNTLYYQLVSHGLTPNKSLTIKFPEMPKEYTRHFIRGCWDGDGTVYLEKNGRIRAGFVSGSNDFIKKLMEHLEVAGLTSRKLYANKNGRSFYFRYTSNLDCKKLFTYLYNGVPENQYLIRKYQIFINYFNNFDNDIKLL